jgi:hypothetical protein
MANYVFAYRGGAGMPATEAEQQQVMEAWMSWFGQLGDAVVDGGAPFGASASLAADGSTGEAGSGLGGYSVVTAGDLASATSLAKGCPILAVGGFVDVYETVAM